MNLSSYKIFSFMGIDVELHWSFILFLVALFILDTTFFFILVVIFTFVTIHELCHSVVAIRNGMEVKRIIMIPIGGMAQIEMSDMTPWMEFKMAMAGPMFNFAAAGVLFLFSLALGIPLIEWVSSFLSAPAEFSLPILSSLIFYSFYANIILGAFNLFFPAFPLDGGRVLRALLAMRYPYLKATEMAKYISYLMASLLFSIGLFGVLLGGGGGIWIMAIAIFIGLGATGEYKALVVDTVVSKIEVNEIMSKNYPVLDPRDSIERSLNKLLRFRRPNSLIIGEKLRIMDFNKLNEVKRTEWRLMPVDVVSRTVKSFREEQNMREIFRYMSNEGVDLVPIVEEEEKRKIIKGVVYLDDLRTIVRTTKKTGRI